MYSVSALECMVSVSLMLSAYTAYYYYYWDAATFALIGKHCLCVAQETLSLRCSGNTAAETLLREHCLCVVQGTLLLKRCSGNTVFAAHETL